MARVLYKLSASPPAVSVMVLADMLSVKMELRDVDWRTMEHKSPSYIEMNPMGTIPVLKDGDFTISESHAILKYLVQKYGGEHKDKLYPSEALRQAKVDERLFFNAGLFFIKLKAVAIIIKMPTLWKMDLSPPACAVRTLGDLLGVNFDYVDVDFAKMEHKSPEYKKMNPLGTVPVLKDGDFILTDSHAIHNYLLQKYGTPELRESLYPSELQTRAIIDQAMYFDAAVFFIRLKVIALPSLFEGLTGPTARHLKEIEDAYEVVEAYIGDKGYIATDHFTLADLSVGVTMASMQAFLELDSKKFPNAAAWLAKLWEIPAFKKYCGPGFDALGQVLRDTWEANKLKQK